MYSMERTFLYNKIKKNGSFHCATRYMLENDEVYLKKNIEEKWLIIKI